MESFHALSCDGESTHFGHGLRPIGSFRASETSKAGLRAPQVIGASRCPHLQAPLTDGECGSRALRSVEVCGEAMRPTVV